MCTIALAWQVFEGAPVVLAANRDEYFERPSQPPAVREWDVTAVAPLDVEAGGTWTGYNEHGVVVTITNRWTDDNIEGMRSRGQLVKDALGCQSALDAARLIERELDERVYNGFHLLVADATAAVLVIWDGHREIQTLEPGTHLILNVGANGVFELPESYREAGERQVESAQKLQPAIVPEPGEDAHSWLTRSSELLADHEYGVCLHGEEFGTKSATRLLLSEDEAIYEHAEGQPCSTEFQPVDANIR